MKNRLVTDKICFHWKSFNKKIVDFKKIVSSKLKDFDKKTYNIWISGGCYKLVKLLFYIFNPVGTKHRSVFQLYIRIDSRC